MFRLCIFYVSFMFHVQFYQLLSGISNVTVLFRFQVNSLKTAASLGSMCRASCSPQSAHCQQHIVARVVVELELHQQQLHRRLVFPECIATVPLLTFNVVRLLLLYYKYCCSYTLLLLRYYTRSIIGIYSFILFIKQFFSKSLYKPYKNTCSVNVLRCCYKRRISIKIRGNLVQL